MRYWDARICACIAATEDLIKVAEATQGDVGLARRASQKTRRALLLVGGGIALMQLQADDNPVVMLNRFRRLVQSD